MGMRIGGLATGMDIDGIINDLMDAERIPLNKLQQDKTLLEWERDAYREINILYSELEQIMRDMRYPSNFNQKVTTSTQPNAITATATHNAQPGSYSIQVTQLATSAINVSQNPLSSGEKIDPNAKLADQLANINGAEGYQLPEKISFKTYHNGEEVHEIEIDENDTLNSILRKITNQDNGVRAFYDAGSDKVIMERTTAGEYNSEGYEIDFGDDEFFSVVLGLDQAQEQGGQDAKFTYNNSVEMTSKTNNATFNGITFNFTNTMDSPAYITVDNDIDSTVDLITQFVDKYNEIVEKVNGKLTEKRERDFPPLTDEQKKEMTESEIANWEEKAKSGLLRNSNILMSSLSQMRSSWNANVETGGAYRHMAQIGIATTSNYMDGGKLEINETKLREALLNDSESVFKLFSNNTDDDSRGVLDRIETATKTTTRRINDHAGRSSYNLDQYSMGKRLQQMDTRIADFQRKLAQVEDRYWRQFTAMEKAIQRMNEQSNYLFSQFNQQW